MKKKGKLNLKDQIRNNNNNYYNNNNNNNNNDDDDDDDDDDDNNGKVRMLQACLQILAMREKQRNPDFPHCSIYFGDTFLISTSLYS